MSTIPDRMTKAEAREYLKILQNSGMRINPELIKDLQQRVESK